MPFVSARVKFPTAIVLLLTVLPAIAHGFGAKAHRIVGYIAGQHLCVNTEAVIRTIIPAGDLAEAGLWADHIRADRDWDFARPWHYLNVPDDVPLVSAQRNSSGDVLAAIRFFHRQLADPGLRESTRMVALYLLVHFVADVHQPLHVGRQADLGGNRVLIRVNGKQANLHEYWDSGVLKAVRDSRAYAADLDARYAGRAGFWLYSDPSTWAVESQRLRSRVYDFPQNAAGVGTLDSRYQAMAEEVTGKRLAQAGIRLAGLLNGLWCREPGRAAP